MAVTVGYDKAMIDWFASFTRFGDAIDTDNERSDEDEAEDRDHDSEHKTRPVAGSGRQLARGLFAGCVTYVTISTLFFGDPLQPIGLATFWSDRLGAPYWGWLSIACFAIGTTGFLLPARLRLARFPAFVTIGLLGSLFAVGAYADRLTSNALLRFGGEARIHNSFRQSVRHAPDEFQFFLHAAALKHCVPFGWSYQSLSFYRIPAKAAVSVLPTEWLNRCPSIKAEASRS